MAEVDKCSLEWRLGDAAIKAQQNARSLENLSQRAGHSSVGYYDREAVDIGARLLLDSELIFDIAEVALRRLSVQLRKQREADDA